MVNLFFFNVSKSLAFALALVNVFSSTLMKENSLAIVANSILINEHCLTIYTVDHGRCD